MKKKITIILCIIFIIFNFIFSSIGVVLAEDSVPTTYTMPTLDDMQVDANGSDSNSLMKNLREGTSSITSNDNEVPMSITKDDETAAAGTMIFTRFATFIVEWINNIPQLAVEATDDNIDIDYFTIYSLVIGEYDFFNMNFFSESGETENANIIDVLTGNTTEGETNLAQKINQADDLVTPGSSGDVKRLSLGGQIKQRIRSFYVVMRNLSIAASLFILIYVGIRMAISTVASEKSKYKKMLIDWVASLMLVLIMHFIIIIFSFASQKGLELIRNLANVLGVTNIEEGILSGNLYRMGTSTSRGESILAIGFNAITSFITIAIFVYYELKFFIAYVIRFCEISVLVVIAPLVTITYSIDKIGDNKAQAFSAWFKELSVKYAIQVVHALTYVLFIATAGVIASEVPLFAAFFLLALDKAEKIFRNMFNIKSSNFEKVKVPILDK